MGAITEQQLTFLQTFGFLRLPGLFADEIGEITEAFEAVFADEGNYRMDMNEELHRNDRRVIIPAFVDKHPILARLPEDERVLDIAHDSGFDSLSRFNRAFKEIAGLTPRQYRKTLGQNAIAAAAM